MNSEKQSGQRISLPCREGVTYCGVWHVGQAQRYWAFAGSNAAAFFDDDSVFLLSVEDGGGTGRTGLAADLGFTGTSSSRSTFRRSGIEERGGASSSSASCGRSSSNTERLVSAAAGFAAVVGTAGCLDSGCLDAEEYVVDGLLVCGVRSLVGASAVVPVATGFEEVGGGALGKGEGSFVSAGDPAGRGATGCITGSSRFNQSSSLLTTGVTPGTFTDCPQAGH